MIGLKEKRKILSTVIMYALNECNSRGIFADSMNKYRIKNNSYVNLRITTSDGTDIVRMTFFIDASSKEVLLITPPKDDVDTYISMTEDTFIKLKRGIITFREGFWLGLISIDGRYMLRDLLVFSRVFDENKHHLRKAGADEYYNR